MRSVMISVFSRILFVAAISVAAAACSGGSSTSDVGALPPSTPPSMEAVDDSGSAPADELTAVLDALAADDELGTEISSCLSDELMAGGVPANSHEALDLALLCVDAGPLGVGEEELDRLDVLDPGVSIQAPVFERVGTPKGEVVAVQDDLFDTTVSVAVDDDPFVGRRFALVVENTTHGPSLGFDPRSGQSVEYSGPCPTDIANYGYVIRSLPFRLVPVAEATGQSLLEAVAQGDYDSIEPVLAVSSGTDSTGRIDESCMFEATASAAATLIVPDNVPPGEYWLVTSAFHERYWQGAETPLDFRLVEGSYASIVVG